MFYDKDGNILWQYSIHNMIKEVVVDQFYVEVV